MEDTLRNNASPEREALELGKLLADHRGGEVSVMDMRSLNFWTDFFVIATVTSSAHLAGLERHIKEFAQEKGMEILRRSRKPPKIADGYAAGEPRTYGLETAGSEEWSLLDMGGIVIHLMAAKTRSFFELERLWSAAPLIYRADGASAAAGAAPVETAPREFAEDGVPGV